MAKRREVRDETILAFVTALAALTHAFLGILHETERRSMKLYNGRSNREIVLYDCAPNTATRSNEERATGSACKAYLRQQIYLAVSETQPVEYLQTLASGVKPPISIAPAHSLPGEGSIESGSGGERSPNETAKLASPWQ